MAEGKAADWGLIALVAAAIWYFLLRKPYKCEICGDTFKTEGELKDHMAAEHPGEEPPPDGDGPPPGVPVTVTGVEWA